MRMGWRLAGLVVGALFMGSAAVAHHSMAMFDQQHPVELDGVVQDFKFVSPHTFILLQVKANDESVTSWSLEGDSPSHLARDGWTSKSLKSGDELKMKIAGRRSGAPGGYWTNDKVFYRDGKPVVEPQ
jgi:hypothetical protein